MKDSFQFKRAAVFAAIALFGIAGCGDDKTVTVVDPQIERSLPGEPPPMGPVTAVERVVVEGDPQPAEIYTASLMPMNVNLLQASPSAEVQLRIEGETLVIEVNARGLPASMMHLQHIHGFIDGAVASCPGIDADTNNDGIIDVIEIESSAGITMVPFHDNPGSMEISSEAYAVADDQGAYSYNQSVSLNSLRGAFQEMFGDNELYLDNRVVFIHGVPENMELPASVQSIPGAPAQMTVPIACGVLSLQQSAQ